MNRHLGFLLKLTTSQADIKSHSLIFRRMVCGSE